MSVNRSRDGEGWRTDACASGTVSHYCSAMQPYLFRSCQYAAHLTLLPCSFGVLHIQSNQCSGIISIRGGHGSSGSSCPLIRQVSPRPSSQLFAVCSPNRLKHLKPRSRPKPAPLEAPPSPLKLRPNCRTADSSVVERKVLFDSMAIPGQTARVVHLLSLTVFAYV